MLFSWNSTTKTTFKLQTAHGPSKQGSALMSMFDESFQFGLFKTALFYMNYYPK